VLLVAMIGAIVLTLRAARKRQAARHMEIGLSHYLTVAAILFTLGIFGIFLNRKNVIIILMSVELMLLAVNINLVAFSVASERSGRAGLRAVRADRRRRRGGDRSRHSRRLTSATAARSRSKIST
jgi:hypothetical protein